MVEIRVNGETLTDPSPLQNWGELLEFIETGEGASRPMVTAVRFDGVDVPTFRSGDELTRALSGLRSIEIEMSTKGELLHDSAQAAYESVAPLRSAVRRIAAGLRAGDTGMVLELGELMGALRVLTTLTAMLTAETASASRSDLDTLALRLCEVLDAVVDQQSRGTSSGLATVLDKQLTTILDRWSSILLSVQAELEREARDSTVPPIRLTEAVSSEIAS